MNSNFSYNLVEMPCIPVLDLKGHPKSLSLRETFLHAHELAEISHSSPIVTASLVRLCVALLTDVYSFRSQSKWVPLWNLGHFKSEDIEYYLDKYKHCLDLFDSAHPFYQCARLEDDNPVNLNNLAAELSSGNNPLLFDHTSDADVTDYSAQQAFHLLITTQNFALAGLLRRTTRLKGETEPIYWQSAYGGTLIPGAMIWLTGSNLFETLCLNLAPLTPLESEDEDELTELETDMPIWRRDDPTVLRDKLLNNKLIKTAPKGTLDRLTFQSRLIRLLPEWRDDQLVVSRAAFNHGRSLDPTLQHSFDPMLAYRPSKKEGYLVNRLSPEKSSWRDFHALIGLNVRESGVLQKVTPRAMKLLHYMIDKGVPGIDDATLFRLNVAGLANDQAKILLWRHDRLEAPAKSLCDNDIASRVESLLSDAEQIAITLRACIRRLCAIFLAPRSIDARGAKVEGAMEADPDRVTSLCNAIDSRGTYWARLECSFFQLLLDIVNDAESASDTWKDCVEREAKAAFTEAIINLGDSPSTWKAASMISSNFKVPSRLEHFSVTKRSKSNKKEEK